MQGSSHTFVVSKPKLDNPENVIIVSSVLYSLTQMTLYNNLLTIMTATLYIVIQICTACVLMYCTVRIKPEVPNRNEAERKETRPIHHGWNGVAGGLPTSPVLCPLVSCCPLLAHPSAPLLAPVMPHQAGEPQSGAQTSKTPAWRICVYVYIAVDLQGVSASINTAPAEGDTCE